MESDKSKSYESELSLQVMSMSVTRGLKKFLTKNIPTSKRKIIYFFWVLKSAYFLLKSFPVFYSFYMIIISPIQQSLRIPYSILSISAWCIAETHGPIPVKFKWD